MRRIGLIAVLAVSLLAAVAYAQTRSAQITTGSPSASLSPAQGLIYQGHLIVIRGDVLSVYDLSRLPKLTLVHAVSVPGTFEEAKAMVAGGDVPVETAARQPSAEEGRKVFLAQGCTTCHQIKGEGGKVGPDLSHEGSRHTAAWIEKKVTDPRATNPKSIMPAHKLPQAQLEALACYLAGLK